MTTTLEQSRSADLSRLSALIATAEESPSAEHRAMARKAASEFFGKYPDSAAVFGNFIRQRVEQMVEIVAPYFPQPVDQFLEGERGRLNYNDSPNEQRMAIEWIVYFTLYAIYAELKGEAAEYQGASKLWDSRRDAAHHHIRRYHAMLNRMRRSPIRSVTVNNFGPQQAEEIKTVPMEVKD